MNSTANAILLISCPDAKGITAAVTGFVSKHGGNIIHADQHIDDQTNTFFMRIEWSLNGFQLERQSINGAFAQIALGFNMQWRFHVTDAKPKVAIFVSKHLHCLYDLLYRHHSGQLNCEISCIVSNHPDAKHAAKSFGVAFHEFVILKENKQAVEADQIMLLRQKQIDLIVLARYHQILSKAFVDQFPERIINIHHSFLPAFVGKNPYWQAYDKGVKLIGATSHYVTEDLDQGPIIEQDTVRVSHRDSVEDLKRKGEDLERIVLSRALRWHLGHKVLSYGHKTVIFD